MKSCWAPRAWHITYYISHPSPFLYLFEVQFFLKMFSICDRLIRVLGVYMDSASRPQLGMILSLASVDSYFSRNCKWKGFVFEVASQECIWGWLDRVRWQLLSSWKSALEGAGKGQISGSSVLFSLFSLCCSVSPSARSQNRCESTREFVVSRQVF